MPRRTTGKGPLGVELLLCWPLPRGCDGAQGTPAAHRLLRLQGARTLGRSREQRAEIDRSFSSAGRWGGLGWGEPLGEEQGLLGGVRAGREASGAGWWVRRLGLQAAVWVRVWGLWGSRAVRWVRGWSARLLSQKPVICPFFYPRLLNRFTQLHTWPKGCWSLSKKSGCRKTQGQKRRRVWRGRDNPSEGSGGASGHTVGLDTRTGTSVPPAMVPVCWRWSEALADLGRLCQTPKGLVMATLDGAILLQPVVQSGPTAPMGPAVTAQEGICAFYDLGLTQINVLQGKGQAESSESKWTEEPPDMLPIEVQVLDVEKMAIHSLLVCTITPICFWIQCYFF